ncbi:MAG: HypC/HybG/HupF family hydrogenase formation chaperone [Spirochaetes bacterium]|nr:HypC/HybG/HupF family hydrogenase formation chaperone [Spirochaetota bacterium]
MCYSVPCKVVRLTGNNRAIVMLGDVAYEAVVTLVPQVKAGDYILLHAGYALEIIDEERAAETLALMKDVGMEP